MKRIYYILSLILLFSFSANIQAYSQEHAEPESVDVRNIVFGHVGDAYGWHITNVGHKHIGIPLPVMIYSKTSGWHVFMSSILEENGGVYKEFSIAPEGSKYEGKLVEYNEVGEEIRPLDFSITKNVLSLFINSILLVLIILYVSRWYKRRTQESEAPKGFIGAMEILIMMIHNDVIKTGVGANYRKFSPYLLCAFFFILINNLMGLVPIFPGGANVTGNIAVTLVLALCTSVAINVFAPGAYWKEIFWGDVPTWLKVPIPLMPFVELLGLFIKPFALMVRLFANILAGHMAILVLTSMIFIGATMGPAIFGSLTVASVLFSIFMNAMEILVAFIQAYVFTMLSSVFIGMAQNSH